VGVAAGLAARRTMPSAQTQLRPFGRRFAAALLVLAAVLGVVLATGPRSNAQSEQLDDVRAAQDQVRAELADQSAAIDSLIGEVSALRVREDKVAGELAEQEAKLADARAELAEARAELAETKRRLQSALADLKHLLVSIYRYGEIDATAALLNADGVDELLTTSTYLDRIQDYESGVVDRVRELRTAARDYVGQVEASIKRIEAARDAIAERQAELAASRARLEQREAALEAAKEQRRERLADLLGQEKDLVRALSAPAPGVAGAAAPTAPGPRAPSNGSTATLNSDGTATAPVDAPQAVKDAIAAANAITNMPYLWGGGHGSFEASGYDCSGSVSYALHGGGMLSSPLDSTGFMTWGEPGPGNWITVYANPGHAYAVIAGLRFDTSGAPPRWQTETRDPSGYVAVHPPGY
jgi:septal ring factor EnvC (AmiA/AmiB activator)